MNIWEIVTLNDLIKILKESEKKFVIVAIVLDTTPQSIKKVLKKFLKTNSKLYENITFLYYQTTQKDLGRISLLPKNAEEYPFVYHIYDTKNIFVSVNRANQDTIYEAFNAVEDYYKKDLQNFLQQKTQNSTQDTPDKSSIVINQDPNTLTNNETIKMNTNPDDEYQANMDRKVLEHQRLLERISLFEDKKKDFNIKFLEDIQKRKKEETKRR